MKKLIGIVAALAVFFALQACGEGDDPSPGIRLSTETLEFPAGKSTLDLVVSCPQQWRLRVSAGWCYVLGADVLNEPCEGKTFKIGVDGNNSLEGREALITLTGADGTVKTVTVTQGAAEELAPVIESFRFRTAANAAKLPQDVVLEVGDGIISGRTSFVVEDKVLVPEFEFEGGGVYLGAQEVVSGETEVDFSGPVVLTVRSKGGEERETGSAWSASRGCPWSISTPAAYRSSRRRNMWPLRLRSWITTGCARAVSSRGMSLSKGAETVRGACRRNPTG